MDVWAGALSEIGIASSYEKDIVLVLNLHTKPRYMLSYDTLRDIALGAAETIIENIYDGGFACLRPSSENIKARFSKFNYSAFPTLTV